MGEMVFKADEKKERRNQEGEEKETVERCCRWLVSGSLPRRSGSGWTVRKSGKDNG